MMNAAVKVLDDKDREFAEILRDLGVPRKTALLITFLSSVGKANPKEIERGADLRQPEVSMTMRFLRDNNWINEREIKTKGKGRPIRWQT